VDLKGKPLLAYTIEAALGSGLCDSLWVSTDCTEIADVARSFGAQIIMRPADLSTDKASTESALIHALDTVSAQTGICFDTVLTLQPTSPLRRSESIAEFVNAFRERSDLDAMLTLHRDSSDFWVRESNGYSRLYPNAPRRRQEREPLFVENSCMYITRAGPLRETQFILGKSCDGFEITATEAIDINEPIDLVFAAAMLEKQLS
jgi:CMP-N,N'-diacetyllegionaminic acid synthase